MTKCFSLLYMHGRECWNISFLGDVEIKSETGDKQGKELLIPIPPKRY